MSNAPVTSSQNMTYACFAWHGVVWCGSFHDLVYISCLYICHELKLIIAWKLLTLLWSTPLICWWRASTLQLPQFITKNTWELRYSLIDHKGRKRPLAVVFCDQLSELFPLNWTSWILLCFKKDIADDFCNQLVFFLKQREFFVS